jgi:hypothetical protein
MGNCDEEKCKACPHKKECEETNKMMKEKLGGFFEKLKSLQEEAIKHLPKILMNSIIDNSIKLFVHTKSRGNLEEFKKVDAFVVKLVKFYYDELGITVNVDTIRNDTEGNIEVKIGKVEVKK